MKIDRAKLKKSTTEVPVDCRALIEKLKVATEENLKSELLQLKTWTFGKCELYHWSDVLDRFDEVLEKTCKKEEGKWTLSCDQSGKEDMKSLLLHVLHFTSLLIEHSFSRHLYNSMEHLTTLLTSCDMTVVLAVLNLLYVFSKRSNFITRLANDKKQALIIRLTHLAESWGGKENGFGLAECCKNSQVSEFPSSATTLHFEFYMENKEDKAGKKNQASVITSIHMENLDKSKKMPSEIMEEIMSSFKIPENKQTLLYTHIRLACLFSKYEARLQCVQARLQALAILVYSNAVQENMNSMLYPGLVEELVDIVEVNDSNLVDIKAASLRTLTSIIHIERNPKLTNIIDVTGASSYHGFLPVLVRSCIQHMTEKDLKPFPQQYATALFSFLYHLASYENGVEALVSCGMMECLLKVINWYGDGQEHITQFVTRAVRVVDLITNLDMAAFQSQGGLSIFINRLENEVEICRTEQPFEIKVGHADELIGSPGSAMETESSTTTESSVDPVEPSTSAETSHAIVVQTPTKTGINCFPQRAALLKSMLNFLKKAIPDPSFSDSIRHLMECSLPKSLKHIISNADYYGPSLFLLATDVVTVYVFQEPSLLSSLQDSGLTDVVLHALLIKDVPATREVLASLPNVFSALCLNARGLQSFVNCKPFDRLFKVLLSPDYLPAMRRRRSSDHFGDTASSLGNAMDELMRHQPSLRTDATTAIIKLLEEVCAMGMDPKYVCQKSQPKTEQSLFVTPSPRPPDNGSSDEEDEDEEMAANTQESTQKSVQQAAQSSQSQTSPTEKEAIPLMDYVLNVMKFVEAILSNNSTDDHCKEFVTQNGLQPLMSILGMPNLSIDFPASQACHAVSIVCKAILQLSREPKVLKQGLVKLDEVLQSLEGLHKPLDAPGGSVLLRELANVAHLPDAIQSPQLTPLLHALSSCHAYIMMFVHVCKMGQTDIRTISVNHWGSELGLKVLNGLSKLYTSLVWESTVLLALCSEDILPSGCEFGRSDMEKLLPKDFKSEKDDKEEEKEGSLTRAAGEMGSNGVSAAMESLSTSESVGSPMDVTDSQTSQGTDKKPKLSPALQAQIKQLKPLLSVSSRLCRTLAELFGLLVKLSVGSPVRQRRTNAVVSPTTPTPAAQAVARALTKLLTNGLNWEPPPWSPVPKLRLTFLVCSVGFTSPMLFDERKNPYHLMLQKFLSSGGQKALFQAFEWALACDGKKLADELPDGTGEFLDAWLMLIEKMVNPKTIMESTHTLPEKSSQAGFIPFNKVQYLISTQKAAFNAVMEMWNKKPLKIYGGRMSESMLAILSHIIKGEIIVQEYLAKEKATIEAQPSSATPATPGPSTAPAAAAAPTEQEPQVHQLYLQMLIGMGFTPEQSAEALLHCNSLEQATEWIVNHPSTPAAAPPSDANVTDPFSNLLEMSEEDQMMTAIAMSLGQNATMSTDNANQPTSGQAATDGPAKVKEKEKEEIDEKQEKEEPLDKEALDSFTNSVVTGCLTLLDSLPETVYRVCDLFLVVTQRNGIKWQKDVLSTIVQEVKDLSKLILNTKSKEDRQANIDNSSRFAARLHLFSLLFEEMMMPCAETLDTFYLTDMLVQVLNSEQEFLSANKEMITPRWLAPLLLLLDLYEKVSVISKRKAEAAKLTQNSHTWKWFDDSSGRWCKYSLPNNKTIDDAYQSGDINVRFSAGRRRYTIHFNTMVQVNEETGNRRPIMLNLSSLEEKQQAKEEQKVANNLDTLSVESGSESKMETESTEKKREIPPVVNGLNHDHITSIIRSVVVLVGIPVEADTLHASLRLVLRLTREHKYAVLFADLGGPRLLLALTQSSSFQGFISLVTLIFRHVMEEKDSLRYCMEKVVKKVTSGSGSSTSGVSQGSMGSKELHYVLRVLGPAACRHPELFTEVVKSILRVALPPPAKRDEDEMRFYGPNSPQLLKCIASKHTINYTVESPLKEVLFDLLNALICKCHYAEEENKVQEPKTLAEAVAEAERTIARQNSAIDMVTEDETSSQIDVNNSEAGTSKDQKETKEDLKNQNPLMPKSAVLRLLSEMIKSYSSCTRLITNYTYHSGQSELVVEDCTVLAYVLDNLLPQCQKSGDKDCPAYSRIFLASIAACNHSPDAQLTLVSELKASIQRALGLPESSEKHTKIQSLTSLISVIIESCPSPGQIPNQVFKGQQTLINNIVKSLLKKGIVADLARIPHSLDLSSPYMANTINSALKPLETLSRSVNQPVQNVTAKPKPKAELPQIEPGTGLASENNTTVEEAAPAENEIGEVTIEDITEEQEEQNEALEESEAFDAVEPVTESQAAQELDNILDNMINRERIRDPESEVIADIIMDVSEEINRASESEEHEHDDVLIDVEVGEDDDIDHHDSQMVSQELSIDEDDPDENAHVHDTPDSESNSSDDDDHECGNDDEDDDDVDEDDDEEDEDDDDEGSDMENGIEDDYQDIEPSVTTHYIDDNFFHPDDMLLPDGGQHIMFNTIDNRQLQRHGLPFPIFMDNDNGNEALTPSVPPAPSNVLPAHPLLVRQPDQTFISGVARVRGGRQRGTCRYNPTTQTLHVNLPRQPNPPAILQRLLGPSTAADVLQLTNTFTSVAGPTPTRVVVNSSDDFMYNQREDEFYEELFQDPFSSNGASGSGLLTLVPSTMNRWTEEAKVLDGDSVHDCVTSLKPEIIEELEKLRDEELDERKEKRRKVAEEEEKRKKEYEEELKAKGLVHPDWRRPPPPPDRSKPNAAMLVTADTCPPPRPINYAPSIVTPGGIIENIPYEDVQRITQSLEESANRPISATEAAAAAERIATAMVEGILAPSPGSNLVIPPGSRVLGSDSASSFSLPVVRPGAPVPEPQRRNPTTTITNLATLLLSDDPENRTSEENSLVQMLRGVVAHSTPSSTPSTTLPNVTEPVQASPIPVISGIGNPLNEVTGIRDQVLQPNSIVTPPLPDFLHVDVPVSLSVRGEAITAPLVPPAATAMPTAAVTTTSAPPANPESSAVPSTSSEATPSSSTGPASSTENNLPDGVDPSFLAALPENIRQEVVAEQLRLQRIQQSARDQAATAQNIGSSEVSAEFLAALPPGIQEEVLAQQRAEQARLQALSQPAQPPSDAPVDPYSFFATLPTSLRRQVLAEMDDSMVAVLPSDLATEAQSLRRELEIDRLFSQAGAGSLSAILRHSGFSGGRLGGGRYTIRAVPTSGRHWPFNSRSGPSNSTPKNNAVRVRGRFLLDHEAMTCLLVLLFVDEPKLNTTRLHRVLRNLCYHGPTRIWVIKALLSMLHKTGECQMEEEKGKSPDKSKRKSALDSPVTMKSDTKNQGTWLSMSLEAALGCRANVFQVHKTGKKHSSAASGTVTIHTQAAPMVCRHALDTLIALAKIFPSQFLPSTKAKEVGKCDTDEKKETDKVKPGASASPKKNEPETDLWDLLVKLDSISGSKKGKGMQRIHSIPLTEGDTQFHSYESSPLGALMCMLNHPVIKRSQLLTDRLLRLLGLVSNGLADSSGAQSQSSTTIAEMPQGGAQAQISTTALTGASTVTTSTATRATASMGTNTATDQIKEKEEESEKKDEEKLEEQSAILENQLQLAVKVLTSKSCSEEGLEDATNLLVQLSWANSSTREAVLGLLLDGARELGFTVCAHIRTLIEELQKLNVKSRYEDDEDSRDMDTTQSTSTKGFIADRYNPGQNLLVSASKKVKVGRELQLPSMTALTSKTSSQQFFLRILKVIIQLRDAARTVGKKNSARGGRANRDLRVLGNIAEAMDAIEAEAEAIMEMVGRRGNQLPSAAGQQGESVSEPSSAEGNTSNTPTSSAETTEGSVNAPSTSETPMDVDQPGSSQNDKKDKKEVVLPRLSEQLILDELWQCLGECLSELDKTPDHHAVLILQPAVEAFFIVHSGEKGNKTKDQSSQRREDQLAHLNIDFAPASPAASTSSETPALARENSVSSISSLPPDTQKFLKFAETHRTVLNQILRQSTTPLCDGPFSVLVDHTRILDFDVKRRYFRQELERLDEGLRREDLAVHIRRENVFEDSFRELFRRKADEWKHRFYIVFEGEEGQDAGGLLREWYIIIAREIFNPNYALFATSPGDRVTYTINPSSHCNSNHLSYFKFVGRIIAKAIYDNKLLDCYFTRSFYKHILGQHVKYTDMESEDYSFYKGLVFLIQNDVQDLGYELTFNTEIREFGVTETRDLKPNGRNIPVNEDNKKEYVKLVCQMRMTGAIRKQLGAFMEGFYDIIPKRLISIFTEQELELLISGLPTIDIDDLKAHSEYHKYQPTSLQVQWFWRALRSFDQADRAQFLQFVTGTSKVPLQGFGFLEGMNGYQKFQIHRDDRSTDRLPVAHTCFNQLDLPAYETYDKLRKMLLLAINECSEGFGLA
ncbi:E3 ubiquitin-protein ligase HUWE1-like isoform X2 [Mytilus galloprovincialis]|uniref:E3 ubiquitin-protein ligase HUWE1-like isoform X2 n=1 Tax=Mytilus galloprovincialis TaxID=29158 RepID=UPI003F7BEA7A